MRTISAIALASALCATGCGDDSSSGPDASPAPSDGSVNYPDAGPPRDGALPLTWVEFSITGCDAPQSARTPGENADAGVPATCRAVAPATLGFTAIAPSLVDAYLWSFGDGTAVVTEAAPQHEFRLPGTYDVTLSVGGPGGTASSMRFSAVEVRPAPLGSGCQLDGQCGGGTCMCDEQAACIGVLAGGVCASECAQGTPCAIGACADLAPTRPTVPLDWQRSACVAACTDNTECPAGLACRDLKRGDEGGWVRGCFSPDVMADLGSSCLGATGTVNHDACTSGSCVAEGARGMCTEVCTAGSCPESAACASFTGPLGPLCVKRCTSASDCQSDPWLACEMPGAGVKGFTVDESASPLGYCAPKRCSGTPGECGGDGMCLDGFCGPQ